MARYALYYMPDPQSPLWHFGSQVLGYDAASRSTVAFPTSPAFDLAQITAWTAEPRQYGFHATLKPPFELAEGVEPEDLLAAAAMFASMRPPFRIAPLRLTAIGPFLALCPSAAARDIDSLAADCVCGFDRFRAPLSPQDRERRLKSPLTPRQIAQLDAWGYPYVFDDFRFHMTLSGPLHEADRAVFAQALAELYAPVRQADGLLVDAIAVFCQEARGERFFVVRRFPLTGG